MNALGYIRVSTLEQSMGDKYGIESQKDAILEYAKEAGYKIVKWCIDVGSGLSDSREELNRIINNDDSLPEYEAVIVYKNDRIARDTKLYFYYFYTLDKRNIKLLSTAEEFQEGNEFANIYRSLLMFVAEQERRNIVARTSRGRVSKAKCGGYSGGNRPYGYKVVDGMLEIEEKEAEIVKYIFKSFEDTNSLTETRDRLIENGYKTRRGREFQLSTIKSILSNKSLYTGMYKYGKMEYVKGLHRPLLNY